MQIKKFLEKNGTSYSEFAKKVAGTPTSVFRYIKGTRFPDRDTLKKIYKETNGQVTPNDFFLDEEDLKQKSLLDRIRKVGW